MYSSSGDRTDHRKEGQGKKAGKRGLKASGSPWAYGRNATADYSRKSSNKDGLGPAKPSAKIPGNIHGREQGSRESQLKHD